MTALVPVADGLFRLDPAGPRLLASRCAACGEVAFPKQGSCPACTGAEVEEIQLSTLGTLWTWTIQRFPPPIPYVPPPAGFRPYGVGYVELPEGVRVEARLTESDPARLAIGMTMELVLETVAVAADGSESVTFAFQPALEGSR